jgi:hypothetical protein
MKEMLANLSQFKEQREKVVSRVSIVAHYLSVRIVLCAPEYGPKLYGHL